MKGRLAKSMVIMLLFNFLAVYAVIASENNSNGTIEPIKDIQNMCAGKGEISSTLEEVLYLKKITAEGEDDYDGQDCPIEPHGGYLIQRCRG